MKCIVFAIIAMLSAGVAAGAESEGATSAQSVPIASNSDSSQDKLNEQLLTVSGMKNSFQRLPEQIISGVKQGIARNGTAIEFQNEIVKIFTEAYPQDGFIDSVRDSMKRNYDEKRYVHLLQLLSTPLAKRMADLEAVEPSAVDMQEFISQVASHPLSHDRIRLIQSIDSATQSSALLTKIMISTYEANILAVADDCSGKTAEIKKALVKIRPEIEKASRSSAQVMLAFVYRDVSGKDLEAYLKTYEDSDSKWEQGIIQAAIEKQFRAGIEKEAHGMRQLVQSHRPKQTMFAPKCDGQEPVKDELKPHHSAHKSDVKPGRDLRECLRFEDSAQVIACTEQAR